MNNRQHKTVISERRGTNEVSPRGTPTHSLQRSIGYTHVEGNKAKPGGLTELRRQQRGVWDGRRETRDLHGRCWKAKKGDPETGRGLFLCLWLPTDLCMCVRKLSNLGKNLWKVVRTIAKNHKAACSSCYHDAGWKDLLTHGAENAVLRIVLPH